jgi:hypothetical protein
MGQADKLVLGDWNASCYFCGFKYKASQLLKHWQGFYVCEKCWEPRHDQDFVRGVPDEQPPPWTQPDSDVFVGVCTPNSISAYPGYAQPGCVIPGYIHPAFDPSITEL